MPPKEPFPRTFYVANVIELFERMAFYGMFVGISLYLTNVVGMSDIASGSLLGNFRLVSSLAPIPCGALADRITFKRSLMLALALFAIGYGTLFWFPTPLMATVAMLFIAIGGGFLKPVIMGTVVRTSPEGRQQEGFAVFYRMINSGSVIGKTLAFLVRSRFGMRFITMTSTTACLVGLGLAAFFYKEPERGSPPKESLGTTLRGYGTALRNVRFTGLLLVLAGFYFMADQFYFTFPKYLVRHIDKDAPLELITLINPFLIAALQGVFTRFFARFQPLTTMIFATLIGSLSMLVMGLAPGLWGACLSGALFAMAEMTFSPRFYDTIASFAPKGKAGMFMGLAFVPAAIGYWIGGQASGVMVSTYLPAEGPRQPVVVWTTYAALGVGCVFLMLAYRWIIAKSPEPEAAA